MKDETKIVYKFILLGDANVGKTCIFKKISSDKFAKDNISTVGVDFQVLDYEFEIEKNSKKIKKKLKIQLYDTAGQERYRSFTKSYINKSNGIIIIYDITERKSFDDVIVWVKSIEEGYGKIDKIKTCVFLVGNKKDLVEGEEGEKKRKVQINEAENLAETNGLLWGNECSAKDFEKNQFDEILIKFAKTIYSKYGYEETDRDNITIGKKNLNKKKERCQC